MSHSKNDTNLIYMRLELEKINKKFEQFNVLLTGLTAAISVNTKLNELIHKAIVDNKITLKVEETK
jgi:hypothetical protein|tara:strand:+ start:2272 stop:2469 length:198 start_codon:yes stop_codon:yes gene_type:complete